MLRGKMRVVFYSFRLHQKSAMFRAYLIVDIKYTLHYYEHNT